ncbi:GTP-binding protein [Meiothermus sp. QL-1]|nr:GTP-binding protein [Meiothermus sp. QL-1]
MLGAFAVGKTSLVARFVHGFFSEKYHTTIGVKIDKKLLEVEGKRVGLVVWDLYGEDRFLRVEPFYLRGSAGYLLVADGTRPETLEVAQEMQERASAELGPVPFVLLLNKHDLPWRLEGARVEGLRALGWAVHYTSAKSGEGVEEAFLALARRLLS